MADSNENATRKGKRRAEDDLRQSASDDVELEDEADGPLADGNAGLTEDFTRDLGKIVYSEDGEEGAGDDDEMYEDDEEDEDEEPDDDEELDDSSDAEDEGGAGADGSAAGAGSSSAAKKKDGAAGPKAVFIPGRDAMAEGETLEMDPSAYVMYHALTTDWSCLSFDVMPDRLGPSRTRFPLTATIVAGTQADKASANRLMVMKVSNLVKTQENPEDDDEELDDDEEEDDEPIIEAQKVPHPGGVNRVRVMPQEPHVVATWSDSGHVLLWDTRAQMRMLDGNSSGSSAPAGTGAAASMRPVVDFAGHKQEGWSLDWSPVAPGRLATGGCDGRIFVLDPDATAAAAAVKAAPGSGDMAKVWNGSAAPCYTGHDGSVEDLQWSPNEATVFSSCSTDGTVRIWDSRVKDRSMLHVAAADAGVDVNVISWSRRVAFLLASGDDKGGFKVWDLRNLKSAAPIASFTWHRGPLYSIEWDPHDENCLVVASGDNTVTLWDMSLEADDEAEAALGLGAGGAAEAEAVPPQLLFVHAGQNDVREAHFHPQLPGVIMSTASDGFNVFKPDVITTT